MSPPASPLEPNPLAAQRAENREHFCRLLRRIVDVGATCVDALDPASQPDSFTIPPPDPVATAQAYHLLARDIRQGMLLADKFAAPIPEPRPLAEPKPEPARERVIREVGDAIHQAERGEAAERLEAELKERLETPEMAEQFADRPVEDIILDLRRSFGLLPRYHPAARTRDLSPASFSPDGTCLTSPPNRRLDSS